MPPGAGNQNLLGWRRWAVAVHGPARAEHPSRGGPPEYGDKYVDIEKMRADFASYLKLEENRDIGRRPVAQAAVLASKIGKKFLGTFGDWYTGKARFSGLMTTGGSCVSPLARCPEFRRAREMQGIGEYQDVRLVVVFGYSPFTLISFGDCFISHKSYCFVQLCFSVIGLSPAFHTFVTFELARVWLIHFWRLSKKNMNS